MGVIYYLSNQPSQESSELSGRVTEVVEAFINAINVEVAQKEEFHGIIRSMAHFILFFVLGILLFIPFYKTTKSVFRTSVYVLIFGFVYAVFDENHQIFVDGRAFQVSDILVDTSGVLAAICMCLIINWAFTKYISKKYTLQDNI